MEDDKNIEDFFRKRLENNDIKYQESDWVMLKQRLDAAAIPGTPGINLSPTTLVIITSVVVTLTFLAGWYMHDYFTEPPVQKSEISQRILDGEVIYPQPVTVHSFQVVESDNIPVSTGENNKNAGGPPVKTVVSSSESDGVSAEAMVAIPSPEPSEKVSSTYSYLKLSGKAPQKQYPVTDSRVPEELVSREYLVEIPIEGNTEEAQGKPSRKSFKERWSIGLIVAPDFNSVGMDRSMKMSALIGGQFYFDLSNRFTLSTGLLLNRKKYKADGEAYSPPYGWSYQSGTTPDMVDGSCKVVDIPLMVSYQWTTNKRVNFATAIGLSNYFLLDEKYHFQYGGGYYGGSSYGWSTEENSKLMLGVANLSVSVQIVLNERMTLSVEPYIKKPLKMVGWGSIDLISTGSLFSLRYRPF